MQKTVISSVVSSFPKALLAFVLLASSSGCGELRPRCGGVGQDETSPAFMFPLKNAETGAFICDGTVRVTHDDGISETLTVIPGSPTAPEPDPEPEPLCLYISEQSGSGVYSMDVSAPGFQSFVIDEIRVEEHGEGPICGEPITYEETIALEPSN